MANVDAFSNVATGCAGTVASTSIDPIARLAANYTFTAALKKTGHTIEVFDRRRVANFADLAKDGRSVAAPLWPRTSVLPAMATLWPTRPTASCPLMFVWRFCTPLAVENCASSAAN